MSDKKENGTGLRLVDLAEFVTRPAVQWAIRGIIPRGTLVMVFGPPKEGKTFAVMDMLLHGACGVDWHGHAIQRPLRVAFLAGEGQNGLRVRLHAWLQYHGSPELKGKFKVLPVSLALPDRIDELIELLKEFAPDVVAIDTLNAYFGAGDENSTQDMTQFVAGLRRLRESLPCSVVIIHHTGISNTERERGSGALRGAADVLIRVRKTRGGSGRLGFQVLPGRDIEPMDVPLALRLRRVETDWPDDDGSPLATCIVEAGDQPIASIEPKARPLGGAQSAVLTIARDLAAAEAPDASDWVGISRRQITCRAKLRGISRQSVSSALRSLEGHGCIRLTETDKVLVRAESGDERENRAGKPPPQEAVAERNCPSSPVQTRVRSPSPKGLSDSSDRALSVEHE